MKSTASDKRDDTPVRAPNLVPILNLVTILIPFLLLTVTFVHLAVVDSSLPAISPVPGPEPIDPPLGLTVAITDRGFVVRGDGAMLTGTVDPEGTTLAREGMDHPYGDLTELMVRIKAAHPGEQNVILMPEPDVPYDVIIRTMDATREHMPPGAEHNELLFPFVVLAGGMTE